MKGERGLLRLGEWLVTWASRGLPARVRKERRREWLGELPAILRDPGTRHGWQRAARMLGYAADTLRAAAMGPRQAPHHGTHRAGNPNVEALKVIGVLLALPFLLAMVVAPVALTYLSFTGSQLAYWGAMFLWTLTTLIIYLATRFRRWSPWGPMLLLIAALVVSSAGHVAVILGQQHGWLAAHTALPSVLEHGADVLSCVTVVTAALIGIRAVIQRRRAVRK